VSDYWLADAAARVLGPLSYEVVKDLGLKGKLTEVRSVSRDGFNFTPVANHPEVVVLLDAPAKAEELALAQAQATRQIREWIAAVEGRPTHEIFRLSVTASREALRAAFFGLVQRYVPSRLPPDATDELRLACEDAFLFLSERMVDIERAGRNRPTPVIGPPPPSAIAAAAPRKPDVSWRGGMIHVHMMLARGDATPFTLDPTASWKDDCLTVESSERVLVNTPADVILTFEGHVKTVQSSGRVVGVRALPPDGFSVKLLDLNESHRAMIRTWVVRADR
jgi:hypothetical protein